MNDPAPRTARYEHVRQHHGVTVYLHGEFDLTERARLRGALDAASNRRHTLCVDLADVSFMDSSGLHELARARRAAAARGARFVLVAPTPSVRRLLELWADTDAFEVQSEREDLGATRR
jgi:anti-sigma B factor antagonist